MRLVLRVIANLLLVVAVLEVCARCDDWIRYQAPLLGAYTVDNLYEVQQGTQRGKAFARYENWRLNSLGMRGPELSPGSSRVLCIGASETLGMLETPGMEYPRQLERELRNTHSELKIDVANLSYFGLTLATANKLMPKILADVKPDIVIIYPTYGGYVARRTESVTDDKIATSTETLRLTEKLGDFLKAQIPLRLKTWLRQREIDAFVKGRPVIDTMPDNRSSFLQLDLENLTATISRYGAQPILVTHATRFNNNEDLSDKEYFLVSWRKFYPLFSESGLLDMENRLNDTVRQFAAQHNIPLVDAANALPGGSKYFTDHVHFTDDGAGTLAKLIAKTASPLIAKSHK